MKLYIAGPMSGYKDFNFPAFEAAVRVVQEAGHEPHSPHWKGAELGEAGWEQYMRWDIVDLLGCDGVVTLPGWEQSKGASLEVHIAKTLGMPVFTLEEL